MKGGRDKGGVMWERKAVEVRVETSERKGRKKGGRLGGERWWRRGEVRWLDLGGKSGRGKVGVKWEGRMEVIILSREM